MARLARRVGMAGLSRAAILLAPAAIIFLSGCNVEQIAWVERQRMHPPGYDEAPLGPAYDTPKEVAQLKDEFLRTRMQMWLDTRKAYLKLWRKYGDQNHEVLRVQNSLLALKIAIEYRRDQIVGPLSWRSPARPPANSLASAARVSPAPP